MNYIKMYINRFGNKIYENSKGQLHRLDGPAIEYANGDGKWYKEGERHRIDGPAIEYLDRKRYWFIIHKKLEENEFNSWINRIKAFIQINKRLNTEII